jgi:hypothetical protein
VRHKDKVVLQDDRVWWLTGIVRDGDGNIQKGYVINGGWTLVIKNNECLAKSSNYIVTRWPFTQFIELDVPLGSTHSNYNGVINNAVDNYKKQVLK